VKHLLDSGIVFNYKYHVGPSAAGESEILSPSQLYFLPWGSRAIKTHTEMTSQ
jgi:hypothetical protein